MRQLFPFISVDIALFSLEGAALRVLLVRRARAPALSCWALPGGVLRPDEDRTLEDAARRVLRQKVDVDIPHLEQVRATGDADRDPRGWSISVLFAALLPRDRVDAVVKSHVEAVEWVAVEEDGRALAFDHAALLQAALAAIRERVQHHALPLHLLPQRFTLTELQRACEAILARPLDKSVFRRRLKGSADLEELDDYQLGAQRPARLFQARAGFDFSA